MESKSEIRKRLLAKREALSPDQVEAMSRLICHKVQSLLSKKLPTSIMIYAPIRNEVDPLYLLPWLWENNITVCLPSIQSGKIVPLVYVADEKFVQGAFGINEPANRVIYPKDCEVVIVPCVAVDKAQFRLGYGKGYYDRYLTASANSIGLIYPFQVVEQFPHEEHDIALKQVATL